MEKLLNGKFFVILDPIANVFLQTFLLYKPMKDLDNIVRSVTDGNICITEEWPILHKRFQVSCYHE